MATVPQPAQSWPAWTDRDHWATTEDFPTRRPRIIPPWAACDLVELAEHPRWFELTPPGDRYVVTAYRQGQAVCIIGTCSLGDAQAYARLYAHDAGARIVETLDLDQDLEQEAASYDDVIDALAANQIPNLF